MDYVSNKNLQEICDLKQPVLFEYKSVAPDFFDAITIDVLEKHDTLDMKIKDNTDFFEEGRDVDFVTLPYHSMHSLMQTDTHSKYFSENNEEFLQESGLVDDLEENNECLKPPFTAFTKYDVLLGSSGTVFPLRYHTHYRHFVCVHSGTLHVKMTPWKSSKYLSPIKDYEHYDFRSPIHLWKPQAQYASGLDKMKCLEFDVPTGSVLYIPPFWWYSMKCSQQSDLLATTFTYNSVMNCVSNIPNYSMYYIQQSNIKQKVVKTHVGIKKEDPEDKEEPVEQEEKEEEREQKLADPLNPAI